jgi:hypothetical protein
MEKLSHGMQERLDKWRANILPVPSAKIFKSPGNFVSRKGDYGDDIRDLEVKKDAAWHRDHYSQNRR